MRYGAMLALAAGLIAWVDADGWLLLAAAPMAGEAVDSGSTLGPVPGALGRGPITNESTGVAAKADPVNGNPLWGVTLHSLSATRERPIFAPSRRPPPAPLLAAVSSRPAPPPPKPPEPERLPLSLVGTILGEGESLGVFQDEGGKAVIRLRIGEGYAGWILRTVRGREASFDKGTQVATVALPTRTGEAQPGAGTVPAFAQTAPGQQAVQLSPVSPTVTPPSSSGVRMDGDGQPVPSPALPIPIVQGDGQPVSSRAPHIPSPALPIPIAQGDGQPIPSPALPIPIAQVKGTR